MLLLCRFFVFIKYFRAIAQEKSTQTPTFTWPGIHYKVTGMRVRVAGSAELAADTKFNSWTPVQQAQPLITNALFVEWLLATERMTSRAVVRRREGLGLRRRSHSRPTLRALGSDSASETLKHS